ncbi:MAG: hypothetical protein J0H68_07180 [Sphingobacteriia bacterium]|nr:hypothetical protein [Sphingobacteriia bacterium]
MFYHQNNSVINWFRFKTWSNKDHALIVDQNLQQKDLSSDNLKEIQLHLNQMNAKFLKNYIATSQVFSERSLELIKETVLDPSKQDLMKFAIESANANSKLSSEFEIDILAELLRKHQFNLAEKVIGDYFTELTVDNYFELAHKFFSVRNISTNELKALNFIFDKHVKSEEYENYLSKHVGEIDSISEQFKDKSFALIRKIVHMTDKDFNLPTGQSLSNLYNKLYYTGHQSGRIDCEKGEEILHDLIVLKKYSQAYHTAQNFGVIIKAQDLKLIYENNQSDKYALKHLKDFINENVKSLEINFNNQFSEYSPQELKDNVKEYKAVNAEIDARLEEIKKDELHAREVAAEEKALSLKEYDIKVREKEVSFKQKNYEHLKKIVSKLEKENQELSKKYKDSYSEVNKLKDLNAKLFDSLKTQKEQVDAYAKYHDTQVKMKNIYAQQPASYNNAEASAPPMDDDANVFHNTQQWN